ncbi:hypothetical protein [Leeuwenhoekiella marinoflava]|uniref:hypothetical protein n=1 Tax=Leeuwenhoekiella marinoflava TaxID=988 RepID=UPI0030035E6C
MNILFEHLTIEQKNIWDSYLDFKTKGIKPKSKKALQSFINSVKRNPSENIDNIALELNRLKTNKELEIQFPIFKEIILPTLIKLARQNQPEIHRIIAENERFFHSNKRLTEFINKEFKINKTYFDSVWFLERELSINPTDKKSIELLVNKIAQDLDYCIHELPEFGLVCDINDFSESLNNLENFIEQYELKNVKWSERLDLLNAVKKTWSDYLEQKSISNYNEYLEIIGATDLKNNLSNPRELIYDWKLLYDL